MRFSRIFSSTVMRPVFTVLMMTIALTACQANQDEAVKPPASAATPSAQSGVIELQEGSATLAQLQTERVRFHPMQMSLKAQAGKILPNENRLAHLSARVPGRIVAVYANLGDRVKSGDRLLLLDSPAFGEAQLEYRKTRTAVRVTEKALPTSPPPITSSNCCTASRSCRSTSGRPMPPTSAGSSRPIAPSCSSAISRPIRGTSEARTSAICPCISTAAPGGW